MSVKVDEAEVVRTERGDIGLCALFAEGVDVGFDVLPLDRATEADFPWALGPLFVAAEDTEDDAPCLVGVVGERGDVGVLPAPTVPRRSIVLDGALLDVVMSFEERVGLDGRVDEGGPAERSP